jgi:hypothetical protein
LERVFKDKVRGQEICCPAVPPDSSLESLIPCDFVFLNQIYILQVEKIGKAQRKAFPTRKRKGGTEAAALLVRVDGGGFR